MLTFDKDILNHDPYIAGSHSTVKKLVSILVPVLILTCGAFFVFLWLKRKGKTLIFFLIQMN